MADPTGNTETNPTQDPQDDVILDILIARRDSFERAYEYWKSQIGAVDEPVDFTDAGNPVTAMLLVQDMWRQLTRAVDRRLGILP